MKWNTTHLARKESEKIEQLLHSMTKVSEDSTWDEKSEYACSQLSRFRTLAESLVHELEHFATRKEENLHIIHGLPTINKQDLLALLISHCIGDVVHYPDEGPEVMDLKVQSGADNGRPSFKNSLEFPLHTDMSYVDDPPDYLCVLSLSRDSEIGGHSLFADLDCVLKDFPEDLLSELYIANFVFPPPSHFTECRTSISHRFPRPILETDPSGKMTARLRRDFIECKTELSKTAVQEFTKQLESCQIEAILPPGSAYIINNKRAFHGRHSFISSKQRELFRVYINEGQLDNEEI